MKHALPREDLSSGDHQGSSNNSSGMRDAPKRILFVRFNDIGEAVMATAAFAAARAACPDALVCAVTSLPSAQLLRTDVNLDRLFVCDKTKWRNAQRWAFLAELRALITELRSMEFDIAIDLQNVPSSHWLIRATGARSRYGLATGEFSTRLHTHRVPRTPEWETTHQVDRFRYILQQSLPDLPPTSPQLTLEENARVSIAERLESLLTAPPRASGPLVCLQPGAGLAERTWPVERFAEIAAWLVAEREATVIVHAGPGEEPLAERIRAIEENVHILEGLTLQELAALLERCDVFVTNDSGPMHMAAALGTPQVAVFGSTDPRVSGPYTGDHIVVTKSLECSPCGRYKFECPHRACLNELPMQDVRRAVEELL